MEGPLNSRNIPSFLHKSYSVQSARTPIIRSSIPSLNSSHLRQSHDHIYNNEEEISTA